MITEIGGKNFKGLEFNQPIAVKTIFVGPNGSGKTARIQALILATLGYIPGGSSKTNAEILNTYSDTDKMFVGFKAQKTELVRRFSRNSKTGSVSQDFAKDGRKISKENFLLETAKAGVPSILDLPEFIKMSDQKKIDRIFELFPPSSDISKLDDQIQELDEKIRAKQSDIRDNENLISKLTESKASIELPPGTLAETTTQIEKTKEQYKETAKKLEAARIEKAEAEATEKAEKEAEEKAAKLVADEAAKKANEAIEAKLKAQQEALLQKNEEQTSKEVEHEKSTEQIQISPEAKAAEDRLMRRAEKFGQGEFKKQEVVPNNFIPKDLLVESIQRILNTINKVGCSACTASMVAKQELRKYQKQKEVAA